MRMLTGTSKSGTKGADPVSFAAELNLGTKSPVIELPNDADLTAEPVKCAPHPHPLTLPPCPSADDRRRSAPTIVACYTLKQAAIPLLPLV